MKRELWVCGQLRGKWRPGGSVWDFQGVFSSEGKAEKACKSKAYFIFPVKLDMELPKEPVAALRARYPLAEETGKHKKPR